MSEPADIAKGLSEAQREFLLSLPQYAVDSYPPARWLVHKGLAEKPAGHHRYSATPLGLAVRRHLLENGNG